jgi:hypothetical protein
MPYTDAIQGPPPPPIAESEWGGGGEPGKRRRASLTGIYVLFAAITMFFAGLTSALVVRRGLGSDWNGIPLPPILWLNTVLLLASSAALETARRALHAGERASVNRWWTLGTVLGLLFMAGQYIAWQEAGSQWLRRQADRSFFSLRSRTQSTCWAAWPHSAISKFRPCGCSLGLENAPALKLPGCTGTSSRVFGFI